MVAMNVQLSMGHAHNVKVIENKVVVTDREICCSIASFTDLGILFLSYGNCQRRVAPRAKYPGRDMPI